MLEEKSNIDKYEVDSLTNLKKVKKKLVQSTNFHNYRYK